MSDLAEESMSDPTGHFKKLAVRAVDHPVSLYHSLPEIKLSPLVRKLLLISVVGAASLAILAHQLKRKRGKKKQEEETEKEQLPWEQELFIPEFSRTAASEKGSSCASSRQNLSLSLQSKGSHSLNMYASAGLLSKYSGSVQSLASARSAHSSHSCVCAATNLWDKVAEDSEVNLVSVPVTTPENLYLMGMELFEEALQRWEQALSFRSRQVEDEANCTAVKLGAGDAIAEETVEDIISAEFIHKLECLLQRAYRLQEEFEATLGTHDPISLANDIDRETDITVRDPEEFCLRDTTSIASTDSFVSAAELTEHRDNRGSTYGLGSWCHLPLYEEAMNLAEDGRVFCRVLRTELLECVGDIDFLAKVHCVRQAFQVILSEVTNQKFFAEVGRKVLSAIMTKAHKNPKRFEAVYEEMMFFLQQADHWEMTQRELAARGVKHINFYDVFLDFILMDSFEDLDNPPTSIQNVVSNRWLNNSFKETAVASSCWSFLKSKRQQIKVPNGFIAHFYAVCEHISPILAWGFLGPRDSLYDLCCFFKEQVLFFMKDIFDFEKVRYTSTECLAEDILHLIQRRTELLMAYLGTDSLRHLNGYVGLPLPNGCLEAQAQ
ncbi:mitoguardin 1 isoform X2 [Stegostoma tigrinum]|nr:mitoguardin 1 isoform X2 [Stegostoma tigrinum]XP_059504105.1 mitoguardin 1 isoform X2 [Stegostoma tigrinum]XP_059504106.1 mitoguardin 1 isoform X2 [Stegostoma tigrinum]